MRPKPLLAIAVASLLLPGGQVAGRGPAASVAGPYFDLGGFHYKVSTESKTAQTWFEIGRAHV